MIEDYLEMARNEAEKELYKASHKCVDAMRNNDSIYEIEAKRFMLYSAQVLNILSKAKAEIAEAKTIWASGK